jgi:hypothetical protein
MRESALLSILLGWMACWPGGAGAQRAAPDEAPQVLAGWIELDASLGHMSRAVDAVRGAEPA